MPSVLTPVKLFDMAVRKLDRGTQSATDRTITRTIKATLVAVDMAPEAFWGRLGISRTTWYNKANGESGWTADEVARAARILGVSVADLYAGRVPAITWGGGDSNPEPDGL